MSTRHYSIYLLCFAQDSIALKIHTHTRTYQEDALGHIGTFFVTTQCIRLLTALLEQKSYTSRPLTLDTSTQQAENRRKNAVHARAVHRQGIKHPCIPYKLLIYTNCRRGGYALRTEAGAHQRSAHRLSHGIAHAHDGSDGREKRKPPLERPET